MTRSQAFSLPLVVVLLLSRLSAVAELTESTARRLLLSVQDAVTAKRGKKVNLGRPALEDCNHSDCKGDMRCRAQSWQEHLTIIGECLKTSDILSEKEGICAMKTNCNPGPIYK